MAYHDIGPLIYSRARDHDAMPDELAKSLRKEVHYQGAVELMRRREIVRVARGLRSAQVDMLLLKGTPLAYTLYPSPILRPRGDTDLLIRRADLEVVSRTLLELGYTLANAVEGELVSFQSCFRRREANGVSHTLDVHWRVNNAQVFARALEFDELYRDSISVPALGAGVRTLNKVHALLLACMHRKSHMQAPYYADGIPHYDGNRLIWLYDIHLLGRAMVRSEWEQFVALASARNLAAVCLDALRAAEASLGSSFPKESIHYLASVQKAGARQVAVSPSNRWGALRADLRALPRYRDKGRLFREHLFPRPSYMRQRFGVQSSCILPFLYLYRAGRGVLRFLKPFRGV